MSNSFKLHPKHFSKRGRNNFQGGIRPTCAPLVTSLNTGIDRNDSVREALTTGIPPIEVCNKFLFAIV